MMRSQTSCEANLTSRQTASEHSAAGKSLVACPPLKSPTPTAQTPPPHSIPEPVRVTLINDDELTAHGLISMLKQHPDQIELVRLTQSLDQPIDVALYDHIRRGLGSGPTLAQLTFDARISKIVLYTWDCQPRTATSLLRQGAAACLSKSLTSIELIEALRAVRDGNRWTPLNGPDLRADTTDQAEYGEVLTARESEMLRLISRGHSNGEIAGTLNLSINTVKSYIQSCYRKINVDSRSKALLWGLSHGFGDSFDGSITRTLG